MPARMDYQEHAVPPALASILEVIWTLEGPPSGGVSRPEPIIPDGRPELIVHFGDAFERCDAGSVERQPMLLYAGQLDRPLALRPTGRVGVLGLRLRPAGASALMSIGQQELVGLTVPVHDVSASLGDWLVQIRESTRSPVEAAALVSVGLERMVRREAIDPRVERAVGLIEGDGYRMSVAALAADVGLTSRQLERVFGRHVGLTPRMLMRIGRLQRALALLESHGHARSARPGTEAAAGGGYADQAHFIRECRALAGSTPSAHLLDRAELTRFFIPRV